MVRERLGEPDARGGFPARRLPAQHCRRPTCWARSSADEGDGLDAVIELRVPEEDVVQRLLARGRNDDTEDVIRYRQQVYRQETAPLLDYYRDIGW